VRDPASTNAPGALVTGASRGIGRAIAITARTVHEGDPTASDPVTGTPLPGSLEATASAIEAAGRRAVPIELDLLDQEDLAPAVDAAITGLGRLHLLVNNAIYVGRGGQDRFLDSDPDELARRVFGNVTAQLILTQRAVNHMVSQGGGLVLDISSAAGQHTPRYPVGQGGWALSYAVTKAGFHRVADMLALECGDGGVRAFNLNPGFVATERVLAVENLRFVAEKGIDRDLVGRVVAWFATTGQQQFENGTSHDVHDLACELGLLA
jgi:NAD(P)-dependent dehydrogenase (short-subunit alcohol dehydrogenase family)